MSKESICQIYLEELRIKVEHQGEHAAFFNFDKTIEEKTFYMSYLIKKDSFPFSIVRMSQIESNMLQNIFYSAIKGEFLRIACSILRLSDLIPKAKEL